MKDTEESRAVKIIGKRRRIPENKQKVLHVTSRTLRKWLQRTPLLWHKIKIGSVLGCPDSW